MNITKSEYEEGVNSKWKLAIVIVCIASLLVVVASYAAYVLTSSHIAGTPSTAGSITLTANSTTPISGDGIQLTATITSASLGKAGWSCQLYNGTSAVGLPVTTDNTGIAVFNQTVTTPFDFYVVATHQ